MSALVILSKNKKLVGDQPRKSSRNKKYSNLKIYEETINGEKHSLLNFAIIPPRKKDEEKVIQKYIFFKNVKDKTPDRFVAKLTSGRVNFWMSNYYKQYDYMLELTKPPNTCFFWVSCQKLYYSLLFSLGFTSQIECPFSRLITCAHL